MAQETIIFGTDPSYRPLAFYDDSNRLVGFDIDLAEAMAEKIGVEARIETMSFDGLIPALQSGRIHVEPEMAIRPQRREQVDFSNTLLTQTNALVVRADRQDFNPSAPEELAGERIGVSAGTSTEILLSQTPGLNIARFNTVADAFHDLILGRLDVVAVDSLTAGYYVQHTYSDKLRVSSASLAGRVEIGAAVRKGNTELLDRLNKAIEEMKADGTLDRIVKKWFGDIPY
ncbi:ABC transporter substrate-binding protein [Pseudochelatococcus sp. B33]